MNLNRKTLEELRKIINEKSVYRSGPQLVKFFNDIGFHDSYGQRFPSRWYYTDGKLSEINGKPELDSCIREVFNPINFIERLKELDELIFNFNKYLAFDGWKVVRKNKDITFERSNKVDLDTKDNIEIISEDQFINQSFEDIDLSDLNLEVSVENILSDRISEIKSSINNSTPLSTIIMIGGVLEGIFLGISLNMIPDVNKAKSSPKYQGKVKKIHEWSLNDYINVFYELEIIGKNVKKFSHEVRDFRNYIHPYHQMSQKFSPNSRSAKISWQVLLATVEDIKSNLN